MRYNTTLMNLVRYTVVIISTIIVISGTTEIFADEIIIYDKNVSLQNFAHGKYYTTRIIDVNEFYTINISLDTQNSSGIGIGVMLYDKFVQWNPFPLKRNLSCVALIVSSTNDMKL